MKYLKFFEAWSSKFHKDLQAAYAQAELTNKGHGKIKKDILAYTTRQVSEEKFTLVTGNGSEIDFYINPEFLLKNIDLSYGEKSVKAAVIPTEVRSDGRKYYPTVSQISPNLSEFERVMKYTDRIIFGLEGSMSPKLGLYGIFSKSFVRDIDGTKKEIHEIVNDESVIPIRFKTKRMLEDFITMVTKAMLSVPGQTPDNIEKNKALLQKLIDTNQNYFL